MLVLNDPKDRPLASQKQKQTEKIALLKLSEQQREATYPAAPQALQELLKP